MALRDDLTPGEVHITRTRGDGFTPLPLLVEVNESPILITGAKAQVRKQPSRKSGIIFTPELDISGATISVGNYEALDPIDPGIYWWDLEIWDGVNWTELQPLTLVAGMFRILEDITNE